MERAWDALCIASGIGIWPRYIEPRLLDVNRYPIPIAGLQEAATGLTILQFSDLHWNQHFSPHFRQKIIRRINGLKPDIVVFTGDFICKSRLEDPQGLKDTLNSIQSKIGNYAVLGNHDYASYVTVNNHGDYDIEPNPTVPNIMKGFEQLFNPISLTGHVMPQVKHVGYHLELMQLIQNTSFQLLNNTTKQIHYQGAMLNICGLEEYSLGKANPDLAFQNYDLRYPGIILCHNPDAIRLLKPYPGDLVLSGHTHGGHVNLPGFWKRFTRIENLDCKRGLKVFANKLSYINKGISSVLKFRWFAMPELTLFTLLKGA